MNCRFQSLFLVIAIISSFFNRAGPHTKSISSPLATASGVFNETFADYNHKFYTYDADWNIWNHSLQVSKLDLANQLDNDIVTLASGDFLLFWYQPDLDSSVIYAMRLDRSGNRLWPNPVLISQPGSNAYKGDIHAAVDKTGYTYVVWHENIDGANDIFAQRVDPDGNLMWPNPMRVSKNPAINADEPAVTIDADNRAVIAWADALSNNLVNIYAQKLSLAGLPMWAEDIQINQSPLNFYSWDYTKTAIRADGAGNTVVGWLSKSPIDPLTVRAQNYEESFSTNFYKNFASQVDWNTSVSQLGLLMHSGGVMTCPQESGLVTQ